MRVDPQPGVQVLHEGGPSAKGLASNAGLHLARVASTYSGHAARSLGRHVSNSQSATASSVEAYCLHANNSPFDEYCLIKIELFLKYTLPTSCFIKIYSLGGFVFPLDIFNLYEAIFTKLKFYRECILGRGSIYPTLGCCEGIVHTPVRWPK